MYTGTSRSDFILRVMQARDMEIDPEVMLLIEDLFAAFERGFNVACTLKRSNNESFQDIGELMRLTLMKDDDEIKALSKRMQEELEKKREENRLLTIKRDDLRKQLEEITKKNRATETEIMVRQEESKKEEARLEELKQKSQNPILRFFRWLRGW